MCPCFASKLVSDRLVFLSVLISGSVGWRKFWVILENVFSLRETFSWESWLVEPAHSVASVTSVASVAVFSVFSVLSVLQCCHLSVLQCCQCCSVASVYFANVFTAAAVQQLQTSPHFRTLYFSRIKLGFLRKLSNFFKFIFYGISK